MAGKAKPKPPKKSGAPKLRLVDSPGVTHRKIVLLNMSLLRYKDATNVKFGYMIARNRILIKPILEALDEARAPSDEYKEFLKERLELGKKHAKKDDNNKPLTKMTVVQTPFGTQQDEVYDFVDDDAAEAAVEKLKNSKKWKTIVTKQEEKEQEYNDLLNEPLDKPVDFYKLPFDKVPEDKVLRAQDLELFLELGILEEPDGE